MDEYIKRIDANYAVTDAILHGKRSIHDVASAINSVPIADVAPVRHGRWKCNQPCPVCGRDRFEGLDADIWADWEPPYCPNCGADMRGSNDE